MPVSVKIDVQGARELRAALRSMDDKLPREVGQANKAAAEVVVKAARPPVRTGRLAGSLRALGSQASGRARAGGASVHYAAAIHWGRKRGNVGSPPGNHPGRNVIVGRPFLTDAAAREQEAIVRAYERAIDELIGRVLNA